MSLLITVLKVRIGIDKSKNTKKHLTIYCLLEEVIERLRVAKGSNALDMLLHSLFWQYTVDLYIP